MDNIKPDWDDNLPYCSDNCPMYDGKRCKVLGEHPGLLCEPIVKTLVTNLHQMFEERCEDDMHGVSLHWWNNYTEIKDILGIDNEYWKQFRNK